MIPKSSFGYLLRLAVLTGLLISAGNPARSLAQPAPSSEPAGFVIPLAATAIAPPDPAVNPAHTPVRYRAQSGDSLETVALHFGVRPAEIRSPDPLPAAGLLDPGQLLILPPRLTSLPAHVPLLPDGEIVFGPSAVDFDISAYLRQAGGFLGSHREYLRSTGWTSAADIIQRVALENSINPRLFLALLEHECGCVYGPVSAQVPADYLLGVVDFHFQNLYGQLSWAANEISRGYYGWRAGLLTDFALPNGKIVRPAPDSNAATVALQVYFANLISNRSQAAYKPWSTAQQRQDSVLSDVTWAQALDPEAGFPALHQKMFGDPWQRAAQTGPLFPPGLRQPDLRLPFETGFVWSYSAGPHKAWQTENALAALDFAPAAEEQGCVPTEAFVLAVADGPVVRSGFGMVIQDLDLKAADGSRIASDGLEGTGWAILYMHISGDTRVPVGTYLQAGDRVGKPSCEGGPATGTHVHIARKFNGEWMAAGGALPFVMEGWVAHNGAKPYQGTLTLANKTVIAQTNGAFVTQLFRPEPEPVAGPTPTPTRLPVKNDP